MALETRVINEGTELVIKMVASFDFTVLMDFKQSYADLPETVNCVTVDLCQVAYMDSSALGMLLNMRNGLEGKVDTLKLINPNQTVNKILVISRFNKLFEIQ